ncbi:MAG: 2-amino-4-hydroxy-6-hydroxymethyldihydropteridine diphosphokinase [Bacteroidota bacterium]|nr:2-amino-4-hydroxy-6-hydroxymethyldihydropteridine diphosphokinase [Bacteroidota bacterium]
MEKVILSLGSNIGNRRNTLFSAIEKINSRIGNIYRKSSIYETEPWGFDNENLFLNMAISVESELSPRKILNIIHEIEYLHGRKRSSANTYQARTLDIDIIFYGESFYYEKDLIIPHAEAHNRKFVLIPILEIEPEFKHPILKQSLKDLLNKCTDDTEIYINK